MTKDEGRRNDEIRMTKPATAQMRVFDIRASDFFRHSSFYDLCKSGSGSHCMRKNAWRLSMNRKMPCLEMNKLRILRFMVPMHSKNERGLSMNLKVGRASRLPSRNYSMRNRTQQSLRQ